MAPVATRSRFRGFGRFFRGHDEIRDEFFAPLVADIESALADISAFHFRVVNLNLVILYGEPTTVVAFKDGSVATLPPYRRR